MSKKKDRSRDIEGGEFTVRFKMEQIETLESGSCFIHHADSPSPDSYAVCKEGKTVKIFKIKKE